ncbi:MAG: transcriptional repressor LexA [Anaerolineae bacterium]|nr:transcriptional repressor LexA [Anaerolineae bacterium]RIK17550.1 MAG: repressor LexA [Anaerolineae bacterium]
MSEKPLSKRQQNILYFTRGYMDEHGRPPTIREIGKAVGINSTSVVNYNLGKLEEKGYLDRDPDVSRGLRLTDKADGFAHSVAQAATNIRNAVERLVKIPLVGDIVAGKPVTTGNDSFGTYDEEDAVELSRAMLSEKPEGLFALRVRGDSMIDAMVNDGDIVIMKPQYEARNGEMVAVWLRNDTTTLKHFYNEGGRVRLQPANPTMDAIYVDPAEVQIQGRVLMVLRQTA